MAISSIDKGKQLARWGLLDKIVESNCPPVLTQTTDYGDFALIGRKLAADGVAFGYAPRRSLLDKILIDAAIESLEKDLWSKIFLLKTIG